MIGEHGCWKTARRLTKKAPNKQEQPLGIRVVSVQLIGCDRRAAWNAFSVAEIVLSFNASVCQLNAQLGMRLRFESRSNKKYKKHA